MRPLKGEKETRRPRRQRGGLPGCPLLWVGLQAHVRGGYFVLYNNLLEVHEVAGGGEPSAARQRPGGERQAGGRSPGGKGSRLQTARSPTRSDYTAGAPACPKEHMNHSCFEKLTAPVS